MRSFANRIFLAILALVLVLGACAMYASLNSLRQDAVENSTQDLRLGQLVLGQLMVTRQQQLATSVGVLARDFGFLDAAATGDALTIGSALANHGGRINAQLATYVDADGNVVASSHAFADAGEGKPFPFTTLLGNTGAPTTAVVEVDGHAYQLVVAPVLAPQHIGWVGIGFELDDSLAATLKELTRLEVSFYSPASGSRVLASTLPHAERMDLTRTLTAGSLGQEPVHVDLSDGSWLGVTMPLGGETASVTTVLQRSLDDALASYDRLFERLAIIFGTALLVAIPVTRFVSTSVTLPVVRLGRAAERIERGDYGEPLDDDRSDELGRLARAFNDMQRAIAQRESKILHQSLHDELTGLPNRASIRRSLRELLRPGGTQAASGTVLVVDINAFKSINDAFGHRTGDRVLQCIGELLKDIDDGATRCGRYGSNSFVLLTTASNPDMADRITATVRASLREPLQIDDARVRVETTIGIARFPEHGATAEDLLRRAEIAMYAARDCCAPFGTYTPGDDERHLRKLKLSHELGLAIDRGELEIHYQPKLNLETSDPRHAEALVRWEHDELGRVSPAEFVPIAEQSGLMDALTRLVLVKTIRQMALWNAEGLPVKVSINVSAVDLLDTGLAVELDEILRDSGVATDQLCLEITETAVMNQGAATRAVLAALKANGTELSIDDFGTGYSSLAQLKQLPVNELKIDQSFIRQVPTDQEDAVIVRSIIELAHNMNLRVVAEGVETVECCRWLAAAGCEMAQGYAIGKPMPAAEFTRWVATFDSNRFFCSNSELRNRDEPIESPALA